VKYRALPVATVSGPGGEKTQPTGTTLEDVVELEEDVWLVEAVETTLEDVVDETVDEVTLDEFEGELLRARTMPTPPATATMAMMTTAATILPIPAREVLVINGKNEIASVFKTCRERPYSLRAALGHEAHGVLSSSFPG
jgi:hypothetical protein